MKKPCGKCPLCLAGGPSTCGVVVRDTTPAEDEPFTPVLMQKNTLLRVTVNVDGGIRTSIDTNVADDIEMRDLIFLIGCIRQLEHTLLLKYNERLDDGE